MLRPGQVLFTYLHPAADKAQAEGLIKSGATCIAYETVTDRGGGLPLRFMAGRRAAAPAARGLAGWAAEGVAVETAGEALPGLRAALAEMEAGRAWVAANFHLDRLYGDGSQIGHWSPLAAYDAAQDRALILDVYRQDYAPHWTPLPRLAAAMALRDPETREARGYAVLRRVP